MLEAITNLRRMSTGKLRFGIYRWKFNSAQVLRRPKCALPKIQSRMQSEAPRAPARGIFVNYGEISSPLTGEDRGFAVSSAERWGRRDRYSLSPSPNPSRQRRGIPRMPFLPVLPHGASWRRRVDGAHAGGRAGGAAAPRRGSAESRHRQERDEAP
jgi:hypothetical protein